VQVFLAKKGKLLLKKPGPDILAWHACRDFFTLIYAHYCGKFFTFIDQLLTKLAIMKGLDNEKGLLERVIVGDQEAYKIIFSHYWHQVYAVALMFTGCIRYCMGKEGPVN
jgi:hypothetical protein